MRLRAKLRRGLPKGYPVNQIYKRGRARRYEEGNTGLLPDIAPPAGHVPNISPLVTSVLPKVTEGELF